jgi:hypothetical protein
MSTNPETVLVTALLFILVFVLGFMLQRRGRPHNVLLLTAHKLIALAALILITITVIRVNRTTPLDTVALVAAAATAVFFVVAIISGGLVSSDRPPSALARALHWVTPFVTIGCAVAASLTMSR